MRKLSRAKRERTLASSGLAIGRISADLTRKPRDTATFPPDIHRHCRFLTHERHRACLPRQKQWRPIRARPEPPRRFHRPLSTSTSTHLVTRQLFEDAGSETIRGDPWTFDDKTATIHAPLIFGIGSEVRSPARFLARPRFIAPNRNKTCQGVSTLAQLRSLSPLFFLPSLFSSTLPFSSLFLRRRYYRAEDRRKVGSRRFLARRNNRSKRIPGARNARHMAAFLKIIRVRTARDLQRRRQIIIAMKTTREKRLKPVTAASPLVLASSRWWFGTSGCDASFSSKL